MDENRFLSCGEVGDDRKARKRIVRISSILLVLVVLLLAMLMIKAYFNGRFDSVESLQEYLKRFGAFGPLFLTFFQAAQVIIPVLPGFLGCAAGAVMFGPLVGFLCNYIGIGAGSIIAFLLAKRYGMPLVQDLFSGPRYRKWALWASQSKSYTAFLFSAMVLPLFPDDFLCYLTGVSGMLVRKFVWIIVLGKPWCILAYSLGFGLIK